MDAVCLNFKERIELEHDVKSVLLSCNVQEV
jgi:hypothetical protein